MEELNKEDRVRDKYYLKTYGITLARYNELLAVHDGACWSCGWKPSPDQNRLAVDHLHYKIICVKKLNGYVAQAPELSPEISRAKFKKDAITKLKPIVQYLSVRGLLCWQCNSTIQKSNDSPERLAGAAKYLRDYNILRNENYKKLDITP